MNLRFKRAVASISGLSIAAFGMVPLMSATAGAAGDETVTKTAYDLNGNPVSTVQGGQVINNVVTYSNPGGGGANVAFSDAIQPGQTYVPNTFKVPTDFNITSNGPSLLEANGTVTAPATGSVKTVPQPKSEIAAGGATGGDGYQPIPYLDRVYAVFHHTVSDPGGFAGADFQCIDATTGALCPGFTSAAIALKDGATDLATPNSSLTYTDPQGRLYIPVYKADGTYGVLCKPLNLVPCAANYVKAGTGIAGPLVQIGGTLYLTESKTGKVAKINPTTMTLISESAAMGVATWQDFGQIYPRGDAQVSGSKVYFSVDYALGQNYHMEFVNFVLVPVPAAAKALVDKGSQLYCYDSVTNAACAGWTPQLITGTNSENVVVFDHTGSGGSLAIFVNPTNSDICVSSLVISLSPSNYVTCYNATTGATTSTPATLNAQLASQIAGYNGISYEEYYDATTNRMYFPIFGALHIHWDSLGDSRADGATACFDWNTGLKCAGFTAPNPASLDNNDYGTIQDDDNPGCAWTLGDEGTLYSYDMASGASPCLRVRTTTTVDPRTGYYCDGKTGHVQGWDAVSFTPAVDPTDWISLQAIVRDAQTNAVIKTIDVLTQAPGGVASIADIDIVAHPAISVEFSGTAKNTDPWATKVPQAAVTFKGDAPQFCYQTKIVDDCKVTSTSNTATVTTVDLNGGAPSVQKSNTVNLKINLGPQCAGDVVVSKVDGQGKALAGAQFSINTDPVRTCTTDANGSCTWLDVPLGTYTVTETAAPAGYNLSDPASKTVIVTEGQETPFVVTFTDLAKPASIDLTKTANPLTIHAGQNVTYTFVVTNTGQQDLSNVKLTDSPDTACNASLPNGNTTFTVGNNDAVLNIGDKWTVTCTIPVSSPDPHTNTATVVGTPTAGPDVTDTADASVDIVKSQIHIEKTASPTKIHSGDKVTYTFVVTNVGDPLSDVEVTDDDAGCVPAYQSGDTDGDGKLDSTEAWTYTCEIPVTDAMVDTGVSGHTNVATATGKDPLGTPSTDDDDALVVIVDGAIQIIKTASPAIIHSGDLVTYTFKVTNIGGPLTGVTVTDSDAACATPTRVETAETADETLTIGETWTYSCQIPVTDAMINVPNSKLHSNTATTKGVDELQKESTDKDEATVAIIKSVIKIDKTADPLLIHSGDNVTYTFKVTVVGDEVHDVVVKDVTDPTCVPTLAASTQTADNVLSEGETWVYTCTIPVTDSMINNGSVNEHTNVATADGKDKLNTPVAQVQDPAVVAIIHPGIAVDKTVDAVGPVIAGTMVTYTYKVTNTGDTPLKNVSITDDKCAAMTPAVGAITAADGDTNKDKMLDVTETWTFTCKQTLNSTTTNKVDVKGTDKLDKMVVANDTVTVPVVTPDLTVTKTDGRESINRGDTLTYTIVMKNVGDGSSKRSRLVDTMPVGFVFGSATGTGPNGAIAVTAASGILTSAEFELLPGASATFTVTGTVAAGAPKGDFKNTAVVDNVGGPKDPTPDNNTAVDIDQLPEVKEVPPVTPPTSTYVPGTTAVAPTTAGPTTSVKGTTAIPGGTLVKTGGAGSMLLLALGLGLMLFGSGILRVRPRRNA